MTHPSPALRLCLLPLLALAGCAGIEIVREPFVTSVPVTTRLQVRAQVVNYGLTASPVILWLKLHAEYWPVPYPSAGQPPCVVDDLVPVGFLGGRGIWRLDNYDLTEHESGKLAPCPCLEARCTGNIDVTLLRGSTPETRVRLQGPNTGFNFVWIPGSDPDDPRELIRDPAIP